MGFMLFKNGNEVEVYHTDIGYDKLFGRLRIWGGSLSIELECNVVMKPEGVRDIADFLDEWEDNPTVLGILEKEEWI